MRSFRFIRDVPPSSFVVVVALDFGGAFIMEVAGAFLRDHL
jgi:hypothetical protein